jgi:hypothetical protein
VHPKKQWLGMFLIDEGIEIDRSEKQRENADSPRVEMRQPGANAKFARLLQSLKQEMEIVSTDEGMQID